jgi:hypothetical protein
MEQVETLRISQKRKELVVCFKTYLFDSVSLNGCSAPYASSLVFAVKRAISLSPFPVQFMVCLIASSNVAAPRLRQSMCE